ncbi:MAG: AraC family transcriptional regulator [Pseudomonadota bacterium]
MGCDVTLNEARNSSGVVFEPTIESVDLEMSSGIHSQHSPANSAETCVPITKVREFDGTGISLRERFDAWHDSFDYFYEAKRAADPDRPANWRHRGWYLNDLLITMHDLGPFVGHRGPDQVKLELGYDLLVRYVREGTQHSLHEEIPVVMQAGQIYVYRADREFSTLVKDRVKTIAVGMSFDAQTFDTSLLPNFLALDPTDPNTKVLMNVMERMETAVMDPRKIYEPGLDLQFRAVLEDILMPTPLHEPPGKSAIQARQTAMKAFVDRNLDRPDFDIEQLLSAFGASRATIFRDFAEDGGLQHYVTSRRLNRAFRDLANAQPSRGKINEVATNRGFMDVGHFSRLFRQQFGITPSDALLISNQPESRP